MNPRSRLHLNVRLHALSVGAALALVASGCDPRASTISSATRASAEPAIGADEPLAAFQAELLELAFETATALPVDPHIKNRSRAQEAVVATCLELDQPRRALGCVEQIDNWRRGTGYADIAFERAQRGESAEARRLLELARAVAEDPRAQDVQDWQRDRIRSKIARTHLWLGDTEQAERFAAGLVVSEAGAVAREQALRCDADAFDQQLATVDALVATGDFEQVRNALETCVRLFDRFHDDAERRARAQAKIEGSWSGLPILVRIELLTELAESALDHGDQAEALRLVDEARGIVDGSRWTAEDHVATLALLAGLRHRAGDEARARSDADAALAMFGAKRAEIVDICRAGALRALAESYATMGATAAALALYRRALEDGVGNPNSRPRAEDLSATCCSMALHALEPDAQLWTRLRQVRAALGAPW